MKVMVEVIPQLGTAVSGAGLPWRGRGRAGAAGPALLRPSVPRGPKKKQIAAYLVENPGVSNKSYIARQLGIDRTTVQKYYDEVRAEMAVSSTP